MNWSRLRHMLWLAFVLLALPSLAHQIPSIQLELDLSSTGPHKLRLNIDPRLVISTAPSSVPPVGASWYRDQTPDELATTHQQTIDYIGRTLSIDLGDTPSVFQWTIQPMDGVTNEVLSEASTEVHLLAEATRVHEPSETSLKISLANKAAAALTIITLIDGNASRRAQVLFPGETSSTVTWESKAAPIAPVAVAAQSFHWYVEPVALVRNHVLNDDLAAHVWFVLLLALCTRRSVFAFAGLGLFHSVHLLAAFGFSVNQIVLLQAAWLWPLACTMLLALPYLKSSRLVVGGVMFTALAILHVLNEWPTAAEPRIMFLMEAVHAALHLAMLLPLLAIRLITNTKKAAVKPPL